MISLQYLHRSPFHWRSWYVWKRCCCYWAENLISNEKPFTLTPENKYQCAFFATENQRLSTPQHHAALNEKTTQERKETIGH